MRGFRGVVEGPAMAVEIYNLCDYKATEYTENQIRYNLRVLCGYITIV
jgi:hypothetical protein